MSHLRFLRRALCLGLSACLLAGCGQAASSPAASSQAASLPAPPPTSSFATDSPSSPPAAGQEAAFPQGEYRAMWISYLEWESVDFSTEASFTADVSAMLDNCVSLGLNVVLAQVRPFGDALYPSELFPFSNLCTGVQGQDPGYDPLNILVREAHSRGLELEAWLNPYRLRLNATSPASELAETNLANTHPEWVKEVEGGLYLDPAEPDVRAYLAAGVVELLENYPLDGIHFDDYFYPTADPAFDAEDYAANGGGLSLEDWRRQNVDQLVKLIWSTVRHSGGGKVRFGVSPQGNNDNNYNNQYSDVALWLSTPGYVDYVAPQLYWGNSHTLSSGNTRFAFENVAAEWMGMERAEGVRLILGLGAYRIGEGDGCQADEAFWHSGDSLASQVALGRGLGADGYALYRYDFLFKNSAWPDLAKAEQEALSALG